MPAKSVSSRPQTALVIGAGFAGLATACCLAKEGVRVTLLEKNDKPGGRANLWEKDGFRFDMGPSWYWMPDVFENFFNHFGKKTSDFYALERLDPSYRVFFEEGQVVDVPAEMVSLEKLFDSYEPGAAEKLRQFLKQAAYKYEVGLQDYVFRPSLSILEFADPRLALAALKMGMFGSFRKHVRSFFDNEILRQIVEFPVLFLGATPQKTPAMYSLMNYADMALGTWYPEGGMYTVVQALVQLAESLGVTILTNEEVINIQVKQGRVEAVHTQNGHYTADVVVANGDYHHVEQHLLDAPHRQYSSQYWEQRVLSPSSLLFYMGVDKKLNGLEHHNLFFDEDLDTHAHAIYEDPAWPDRPLFYVCCPSKTDNSVAPEGCENVFILIPLAPGLNDDDETRERYYHLVLDRMEELTGQSIKDHVILRRSYAHRDFKKDYHAYKGNAYGLSNTLLQTAFLKPKMRAKNVKNLFYTGQLTVPGPGVPPSLISGQVVSRLIVEGS